MDTEELQEKLQSLECPINWNLENMNKGNSVKKLLQRSDTKSEKGDASSTFNEISLFLCAAYLEYHSSDEENKMTDHLKHVEEVCEKRGEIYSFIKEYSDSVMSVTSAMWAYYYFKEKNVQEAMKYLDLVSLLNNLKGKLGAKLKAGIYALKSCCFMAFGPHDNEEALKAITKAVELDGEEAEWSFLNGKCLARTRRCLHFRSVPTEEELACLRKAVYKNTKSPSHYVFCALSCQERGLQSRNDHTNAKKKYLDESYLLFQMAAAYSFDSPTSLARIARGLMRNTPSGHQPPMLNALVEKCVKRSYQLCPDSGLVNHVAGNFYSKMGKANAEKYLFHLKKAAFECGVYGAYMNLFDMYSTHRKYIDVDFSVNRFWEEFKEIPIDRFKALKPMAAYYFFVKEDFLKAFQFCKEWLESPQNKDKNHRSNSFAKCDNLTEAIAKKVEDLLNEENSSVSLTAEQRDEIEAFLDAVEDS